MAHLFRDCALSKQVLEGIGVKLLAVNMQQNWKQWLKEEVMKCSIMVCRLLVISFWAIWHNRNKIFLYHEGVRDQIQDVIGFIHARNRAVK